MGVGAGICLELEPEPEQEISKMGGSGNPDLKPEVSLPQSFVNPMFILVFFFFYLSRTGIRQYRFILVFFFSESYLPVSVKLIGSDRIQI